MSSINITDVPEVEAHLVPCEIQYTGEAKTHEYYTPSKTEEDGHPVSYFRGCKFLGQRVDMNNHIGYVMTKSEALTAGDDGDDYKVINNYTSVAKFRQLTVYGHDRLPEPTDKYRLIGEWERISSIIHE